MTAEATGRHRDVTGYRRQLTLLKSVTVALATVCLVLCVLLLYATVLGVPADDETAPRELSGGGGIEVIKWRDRMVLVVPEGTELISWRPPALSDLRHYGDRLYRLRDPE